MVRNVVIFGATGSIGSSVINVIRRNRDKFNIIGITGNSNIEKLAEIAHEFKVENIGIFDEKNLPGEEKRFLHGTHFFSSIEGFCEMANLPMADAVVIATVGLGCLWPTMTAIDCRKTVLLATKDILVVAGRFICAHARECGVEILPIDSEHNAIFQCLQNGKKEFVEKLVLTASGGPFKDLSLGEMEYVTVEQTLRHPTWTMGAKNTVDSATMANKGMELIEARWLFDIVPSKIEAMIHPESIVHSMVEFCDGSVIAQLSPTSMEFPISYCLFYPERERFWGRNLHLSSIGRLTFEDLDFKKFPMFDIARQCVMRDDNSCAVYQVSNEIAVEKFLQRRIKFTDIAKIVSETLQKYSGEGALTFDGCLQSIERARDIANSVALQYCR